MRMRGVAVGVALVALPINGCGGQASHATSTAAPVAKTTSVSGGRTYGPLTPGMFENHASSARPSSTTPPTSGTTASATTAPPPSSLPPPPPIVGRLIPFGPTRLAETVAYVRRHYGSFMTPTWRLTGPRAIVIHYTEASLGSTFATFSTDAPDSELHELPATCAHFVIDSDGTIYQLVPTPVICRHTVGLNWTAIGIEHVGFSDGQVLGDPSQLTSSLRLVDWLRCRYRIPIRNVIGHNESLASPYHREDVAALRTQTHGDFVRADMDVYRADLRRRGTCASP